MIPKWAQDIRMEDIQHEGMLELADVVGMETMLKIVDYYSGGNIYFPKIENLLCGVRDRHIKEEYNGVNSKRLAAKYNVSESYLWRIVKNEAVPGQVTMFDVV